VLPSVIAPTLRAALSAACPCTSKASIARRVPTPEVRGKTNEHNAVTLVKLCIAHAPPFQSFTSLLGVKGVCSMCGVQILDTTYYKQTGGGDLNKAAKLRESNEALQREIAAGADKQTAPSTDSGRDAVAPALDKLASRAPRAAERMVAGAHMTAALAACAPSGGVAFQPSGSWTGSRPGLYYGTGAQGTGYYPDSEQLRMASARDATAIAAAAAAGSIAAGPSAVEMPVMTLPAGVVSVGATAAALATAGVEPRHDPESLKASAAAKAQLVGGSLTSSMGAAGRPLMKPPPGSTAVGPPPGWAFEPGSGMYYDVQSQQYWHPERGLYYDCAAQTWSATPKASASAAAQNAGVKKTRVADKWGL
jgi:OCRE domain